jgi:acyl dehydratase
MAEKVLPAIQDQTSSVNYGLNNLRFLNPISSGSRVQGYFSLKSIVEKAMNQYRLTLDVSIEIENQAKPALVAEWLILINL